MSNDQQLHHVPPPTRVLLYSHDSVGLGHLRRTTTLAEALTRALPGTSVLIASGSPCATYFHQSHGVDIVKLPSITKDAEGAYVARSLPDDVDYVLEVRRRLLLQLFEAYAPDLLIVDHQVTGLHGEMLPVLDAARDRGARTILGLRDIIDSPDTVARDLDRDDARWALEEAYDRICVYGCPTVFDPRIEYSRSAALAERAEFTGYVVRPAPERTLRPLPADRPQVLFTVGGGEDGAERIETYLECLPTGRPEWDSTVILGPLLDPQRARRIKRAARLLDGITVHAYHSDLPRLLGESDAVVGMAGYNTTAEILQSGVPAVLLPRTFPRREQQIRADRLADLGLAQSLPDPDPRTLRQAVERALSTPRCQSEMLELDGARRLCGVAAELVGRPDAVLEEAAAP
jgi:predicted glycosyltransferase